MNILTKKTGKWEFLTKEYEHVSYTDFDDIPKDLSNFLEMICFLPDIPPPPHTVQQHEIIHSWNKLMETFMEKIYATRN